MADDSQPTAGEGEAPAARAPVCAFKKPVFKKKAGGAAIRKRARAESSGESGGSSDEESVLLRKQAAGKKGANNSKQAKKTEAAAPNALYESNRSTVPVAAAGGATYTTEIDTEHDRDQRAMLEMAIQAQQDGETNDDTKIYRGAAFYKNYVPKDAAQIGGNKFTGTQGPIRAPTFLRATCVFDYKPDICKDYKETGYCGFGDSCKFIHDRTDYKSGYELEAEWEAQQKKRRLRDLGEWAGDDEEEDDDQYVIDDDEDLPFACFICRDGFRDPVVTLCGHYFCQQCALERNKTDPRCAACNEKTGGVFNFARKLYEKLKKDEAKKAAAGEGAGGGGPPPPPVKVKAVGGGEDGEEEGEDDEEEGAGEESLVIEQTDKASVSKVQKRGAWSTV